MVNDDVQIFLGMPLEQLEEQTSSEVLERQSLAREELSPTLGKSEHTTWSEASLDLRPGR